eukprot:CAMPEP_0184870740 /NCGR_PEP_ID=MMETSP0580-20130426/38621_1 /TAXON_ID=1118495 /ORGANISM="Dactyliosolen fragilissimus" /LENGTH=986 /DNA_ID=CAMNT_0027373005 /DNA_START=554 /DNA_END=3514 /DNA_ORIENTATION=-
MVWKKAIAESTIQDDMIESSIWDSDYQRKVWEMFWGYRTTNLQERTLRTSKDTPKGPKLVIAGKMTVDDAPCNIAQLTLKTEIWSLTERIQLSLYNSYSGGEVYSLLANHTFEASSSEENIGPVFESEDKENFSRSKSYDDHRGDDLIVVGAFDTTYRNSQVTYCSVGAWNGKELSKVGEGLCNSALSKGMKITAAAFAGPQDVYVAGSFVTQVWNGERHEFVKIYNIAHYNAVEQVWLPIPVGQITCSWCTVTVLALAWDSIRRQLHVAGKFNAIDGRNIPSALAIYDANSGHLVAHPGGGLTMYNRTQDGVATALQLDEEAGVLYIMGSFERVGDGRFCAGLAALEINNSQWTCLADAAHSVMPSGGGNMLLTPYGLMVAGRTTSFTTWPDSSRPYTIALLKAKLKNKEEKGKKRGGSNSNDLKNMNKTVSVAHENMEASHNYEWSWLPGFIGHTGPLHTLANGFGEYEGTVFIGGENFVGRWYYEERTEVEKTSGANQSPSHSGTGTTQTTLEPVTINLSQDHVRGAIMAIAQLDPRSQNNSQNTNVLGYTIAVYFIALGALLGMFLALLCNRSLNQTILSIIFAKDAQTKGISLDTLTYSAVENTNVAEAYQRAMRIRFVQHPHLLTLIDPQEIILHRIIGEGTFGRVWSAKWRSASVAVKEFVFAQAAVAGRSTQQRNIIEEIIGEAGMMAILRHPHVLQLFGCSLTAQAIWIVSELCSLGSLRQLLDDKDRDLPLVLRLKIALQVAEGMMYLHNQDPPIIHRDLKSHNIFVHETFTDTSTDLGSPVLSERSIRNDKSEESHLLNGEINYPYRYDQSDTSSKFHSEATVIAKIGDWGSARATLAGSRTMTHGVGTACWLAPEVIKYARSSKYSDVYGYGIILWELATREEVYAGLESTQIIANVANENLRPPIVDECPWSDLMVTCWSENPTDRMTFVEIVKELNKILAAVIEEDQSSQNLSRQSSFSHSSYQYHQNEETI